MILGLANADVPADAPPWVKFVFGVAGQHGFSAILVFLMLFWFAQIYWPQERADRKENTAAIVAAVHEEGTLDREMRDKQGVRIEALTARVGTLLDRQRP